MSILNVMVQFMLHRLRLRSYLKFELA